MTRVRDILLAVWFVGVAGAFWGAYVIGAAAPDLTALFGLALLAFVAALLLRWLGARGVRGQGGTARG